MNVAIVRLSLLLALCFGLSLSVQADDLNSSRLKEITRDYFTTYSLRLDFDRLMSFYAEDAQLEDIIYGNRAIGKAAIREFLDWGRGDFKLLQGDRILSIEHQSFGDNRVVTEGVFHQFSYQGNPLGPWRFVIILTFNSEGKITQHIDWINYTPREDFLGGENLNPSVEKASPN